MKIPVYKELVCRCEKCDIPSMTRAVWKSGSWACPTMCYTCINEIDPHTNYVPDGKTWNY